jgi:hypothetical protein
MLIRRSRGYRSSGGGFVGGCVVRSRGYRSSGGGVFRSLGQQEWKSGLGVGAGVLVLATAT